MQAQQAAQAMAATAGLYPAEHTWYLLAVRKGHRGYPDVGPGACLSPLPAQCAGCVRAKARKAWKARVRLPSLRPGFHPKDPRTDMLAALRGHGGGLEEAAPGTAL